MKFGSEQRNLQTRRIVFGAITGALLALVLFVAQSTTFEKEAIKYRYFLAMLSQKGAKCSEPILIQLNSDAKQSDLRDVVAQAAKSKPAVVGVLYADGLLIGNSALRELEEASDAIPLVVGVRSQMMGRPIHTIAEKPHETLSGKSRESDSSVFGASRPDSLILAPIGSSQS